MNAEAVVTTTAALGIADSGMPISAEICPLAIELGPGFADPSLSAFKPSLIGAIAQVRQTVSGDLGFAVPPITIDNLSDGAPLQYSILIRGVAVATAMVYPSQIMAINTGTVTTPIGGTPTIDPVFGNPAVWIDPAWAPQATGCGYALVDPALVIATHLAEVVRQYASELLDWDTVQTMIDRLSPAYRALVPSVFALGEIHRLLGELIDEGVSIQDLPAILEGAWQARKEGRDAAALREQVRARLALTISAKHRADDGAIHALTLSSETEATLCSQITTNAGGATLTLDQSERQNLVQAIRTPMQSVQAKGFVPTLVCQPGLRAALRGLLSRELSDLRVLSTGEIARGFTLTVEETITLATA